MAAALKIDRDEAKELLAACGLKTAKKLNDTRLLAALTAQDAIDEAALDDLDAAQKKLYKKIVKANEKEQGFELTGGDEEEAPKKKATKKAPAKKGKKKVEPEPEEEEEDEDEEEEDEEIDLEEAEDEDEEEEEEAPKKSKKGKGKKEPKKESKKGKKAKKGKGNGATTSKTRSTDEKGRTAKDRVYLAWKKAKGDAKKDYDGLLAAADAEHIAPSTIRSWTGSWNRGVGLPRIATKSA